MQVVHYSLLKPTKESLYAALPKDVQYRAKPLLDTLVYRVGSVVGAAYFTWALKMGMTRTQRRLFLLATTACWVINSYLLGVEATRTNEGVEREAEKKRDAPLAAADAAQESDTDDVATDEELLRHAPAKGEAAKPEKARGFSWVGGGGRYAVALGAWLFAWNAQHIIGTLDGVGGLLGRPTLALSPPGVSQLQDKYVALPLVERLDVTHDVVRLRFGLPDATQPLRLSTTACILCRGGAGSGLESVVRPYTPVSSNAELGTLTLLVKVYPQGVMSRHLGALALGGAIECTHTEHNVKRQYPFTTSSGSSVQHVVMLAGGSGITPMIQALHALLGNASDHTHVTLLYSNKVRDDIIAAEALERWQTISTRKDRRHEAAHFRLVHTLTREPAESGWSGRRGRIDRALLNATVPEPSESVLIFVCGPDGMYEAYSGPRRGAYGGLLQQMGYRSDQVVKL